MSDNSNNQESLQSSPVVHADDTGQFRHLEPDEAAQLFGREQEPEFRSSSLPPGAYKQKVRSSGHKFPPHSRMMTTEEFESSETFSNGKPKNFS